MSHENLLLVCNLDALTPAQREQHTATTHTLFASRRQLIELPDGYALEFPFSVETCTAISEFMALEHLCCPFFALSMDISPVEGEIRLALRGSEEIKQFLRMDMNLVN